MKTILAAILLACSARAAVPQILSVTEHNLTRSSVQLIITTNVASYVQVYYRTGSTPTVADYPATAKTTKAACCLLDTPLTVNSVVISGIAPNTKIYYLATARPNLANNTDICATGACGAVADDFTTLNLSFQSPTAPTSWVPSRPDTTSYTLVTYGAASAAAECLAVADVSNPGTAGWSGAITTGDSLQDIADKVGWSTHVQQVSACTNEGREGAAGFAVQLPYKDSPMGVSNTDPAHPWIVWDVLHDVTKIPPFGGKMTSHFQSELIPQYTDTARTFGQFFGVKTENGYTYAPHHYWIGPMRFEIAASAPSDTGFGPFLMFDSQYILTVNTNHIVFDRIAANMKPPPYKTLANMLVLGGNYMASVGTTISNNQSVGTGVSGMWQPAALQADAGPYYLDNNDFQAVGFPLFNDDTGTYANNDQTVIRNTLSSGCSYSPTAPNWAGYNYTAIRNGLEWKQIHRAIVRGNIFSCILSTQSTGALFLSGRSVGGKTNGGTHDVSILYNLFDEVQSGISIMNGNPYDQDVAYPTDADSASSSRIQIKHNIMSGLDAQTWCPYSYGCTAGVAYGISLDGGPQDVEVDHNTIGPVKAQQFAPATLLCQHPQQITNKLIWTNNIHPLSKANDGAGGIAGLWDGGTPMSAYDPVLPSSTYAGGGASPDFQANLNNCSQEYNGSSSASATWSGNVGIGGQKQVGEAGPYTDMSMAEVNTYKANWPASDTWPTGATVAARWTAAGVNTATWVCTAAAPCENKGADIDAIYQASGRVTAIQTPVVLAGTVLFDYMAPDTTRACGFQFSTDGGTTWGAFSYDTTGARHRTLLVVGLSLAANYTYRGPLCYSMQDNDNDLYAKYLSDQITHGAFTTTGGTPITHSKFSPTKTKFGGGYRVN